FGNRLDHLRESYGKPMHLTSAARSKAYNQIIGGHPKSLHVYDAPYHNTGGCCAVDVRIHNSIERAELVRLALQMNFSVGVNKTFIHIDDRTLILGMPQALFLY
ncbi:MAG: D-Ala-D-Ala carboxypeptidase family metallohydrolase, partial [Pseudomonadota bacterium]